MTPINGNSIYTKIQTNNKVPIPVTKPSMIQRQVDKVTGLSVWWLKNLPARKAGAKFANKRPKLPSTALLQEVGQKTVTAANTLLYPEASIAGMKMEIDGSHGPAHLPENIHLFRGKIKIPARMRNLLIKIAQWLGMDLTPTALLARAIEEDFSGGVCRGMCQAYIGQLGKHPDMTISELTNYRELESETAILQGLHVLEIKIQNTGYYRNAILEELEKDSSMTPQEACSKLGIQQKPVSRLPKSRKDAIKQLEILRGEGIALLMEVREEIQRITGRKEETQTFDLSEKNQEKWTEEVEKMQKYFLDEDHRKPTLLSMFSQDIDAGHAILVDPANVRLFDPNTGWFTYKTREKMITALLEIPLKVYPEYGIGSITLTTYTSTVYLDFAKLLNSPAERAFTRLNEFLRKGK